MPENQMHMFGGLWTDEKLKMIRRYLRGYTTALKKKPFNLTYIDAFAGTRYREKTTSASDDQLLLSYMSEQEPQDFLDGSARIALQTKPPFHRYVFVEQKESRFQELMHLKTDFPDLADRIHAVKADCNDFLQAQCAKWDTKNDRAVLFLDPYGMQIDWTTIEAIAATRSIDVWILFPLGIAVNRLLRRDGKIPPSWRARLDRLFGTPDWFERFYDCEKSGLFDEDMRFTKSATFDSILRFYNDRLGAVFAGVAPNPRMLSNSTGNPLFLLCFAVANPEPRAKELALRIAEHILESRT